MNTSFDDLLTLTGIRMLIKLALLGASRLAFAS